VNVLAEIVGDSAGIRRLREQIEHVLKRAATGPRLPPILLRGETGTGKGLVVRTVHRAGPRAAAPFVDVNCAAIPDNLLEAELFGYERGAFTGAHQAKPGLFQLAHHGMLFLDEIGMLSLALQAKLLDRRRDSPRCGDCWTGAWRRRAPIVGTRIPGRRARHPAGPAGGR